MNKKFICRYCGRKFNDGGNLVLHEDVCINNNNANHYQSVCQYCGKTFTKGTKGHVSAALESHLMCCKENPNNINCICEKCGSKFETQLGLLKHLKRCNGIKKKKISRINCSFCGKEILNAGSLVAHEKYCQLNPNKEKRAVSTIKRKVLRTNVSSWNKGLTAETDERVKLYSLKSKEAIKKLKEQGAFIDTGKASTVEKEEERKKKISETMKKNPLAGGKRHGSGRGKKGWYNGYFCDSSWELAFVIYNVEHGIAFQRNNQGFEYEYLGEKHKFYPDFIMNDGTYVEIKGAMTEQNKVKIKSFQKTLIVIGKKEIGIYLDYVIKKYGNNFVKLYESVEK